MSERQKPWTPGPWHVDAEEGGELTGVDAEIAHASDCEPFALSEYRICGATPYPRGKKRNRETGEWEPLYPEIATVTFDPRREDADQYRASAHLIAAAPELVEALEEFVEAEESFMASTVNLREQCGRFEDMLTDAYNSAKAVLAKIYGDTPENNDD